jgi:hypothetical protein
MKSSDFVPAIEILTKFFHNLYEEIDICIFVEHFYVKTLTFFIEYSKKHLMDVALHNTT